MRTFFGRLVMGLAAMAVAVNGYGTNFEAEWWWQESDKINDYVERYKHIAIAEMDRSNIPASIKMAQGILESGSGLSELATVANNHFGIKCGGDWAGLAHYVWDDEPVKSCFRVYESAEQSYVAHSEFLRNPLKEFRYGPLFKLEKTDYKGWANGLQQAGYATSKTYAEKLISLIERYELYKLDHLTLQTIALTDAEIELIFGAQKAVNTARVVVMDTFLVQRDPLAGAKSDTVAVRPATVWGDLLAANNMALFDKEFKVNKLPVVLAREGEDLAALAMRVGVSKRKLVRYNELKNRDLQAGQYIFLSAKSSSNKTAAKRHVVREGQTMYDIAQYYGLKLRALKRLNARYKRTEPQAGAQLRLN